MQIERVSPDRIDYAGPMESAAVFRATEKDIAPLDLQVFEDDLDRYLAAFFLAGEIGLAVQRHDGNEPGTYTIVVDATAAGEREISLSTLTRTVLHDLLDLDESTLLWTAAEKEQKAVRRSRPRPRS